jgi:hypothetical protein
VLCGAKLTDEELLVAVEDLGLLTSVGNACNVFSAGERNGSMVAVHPDVLSAAIRALVADIASESGAVLPLVIVAPGWSEVLPLLQKCMKSAGVKSIEFTGELQDACNAFVESCTGEPLVERAKKRKGDLSHTTVFVDGVGSVGIIVRTHSIASLSGGPHQGAPTTVLAEQHVVESCNTARALRLGNRAPGAPFLSKSESRLVQHSSKLMAAVSNKHFGPGSLVPQINDWAEYCK